MCNWKMLGAAMVAVLSMSAMVASAAQAEIVLTTGATPSTHNAGTVSAEQYGGVASNLITFFGAPVHCEDSASTFTGSVTGTDTDLTITPSYKDCYVPNEAGGVGLPMTVTMNGCDYVFTQPETAENADTTFTGKVDVVCPEGQSIKIHIYLMGGVTSHAIQICELTVQPQKQIGHVVYHNIAGVGGKKDDVTVTITASGIAISEKGACGEKEEAGATYNSTLTMSSPGNDLWFSTRNTG